MDIRSEIESWFSNIRGKDFVIIIPLYEWRNKQLNELGIC